MTLIDYIIGHAERGACTCGKCLDAPEDPENKQPTGHTADVGFFKVSAKDNPDKRTLVKLILEHKSDYGDIDIFDGMMHDVIKVGAFIGDQALGLMLMGLGDLLGIWKVRVIDRQPLMQVRAARLFAGTLVKERPVVQVIALPSTQTKMLDAAASQAVYNHSPDGFNWGYSGSGPAQLALAILLEIGLNVDEAQALYQNFKQEVVAGFPKEGWLLPQSKIDAWLILHR